MIGYLGKVVFSVSSDSIMTFKDMSRDMGIRTSKYDISGRKSLTSFDAPELQKISFTIQLMQSLTPDVDSMLSQFETMCESGEVVYFVIGDDVIGKNQWIITNISESRKVISNTGKTMSAEVSIQLEEYIQEV